MSALPRLLAFFALFVNVRGKHIDRGKLISDPDEIAERRLRAVAGKYEIRQADIARLRKLQNFDVVILCDDSGSMSTPIDENNTTRWDQLRKFVRLVAEISTIFDSNGVDIHFLNRKRTHKITDPKDTEHLFDTPPSGFTPLTRALQRILKLPAAHRGYDKNLLVFIATDGTPTDDNGEPDLAGFEHVMRSERQAETTHVMFLICTDDLEAVHYLRQWDRAMENVDVTDDYQDQRRQVQAIHGPHYSFPMSAYVVKILIGAIEPRIDHIDE